MGMSDRKKTALMLSFLIFPGAGHFYLGNVKWALLYIGTNVLAIIYAIYSLYQKVEGTLQKYYITSENMDVESLMILKQVFKNGELGLSETLFWLALFWMIPSVDLFFSQE